MSIVNESVLLYKKYGNNIYEYLQVNIHHELKEIIFISVPHLSETCIIFYTVCSVRNLLENYIIFYSVRDLSLIFKGGNTKQWVPRQYCRLVATVEYPKCHARGRECQLAIMQYPASLAV
jgi:hypothetical protein